MIRDAEVAAQAGLSHAEVMQRMRNLRASARLANGAARPLVTPDTV
jgi:hypothetical protein